MKRRSLLLASLMLAISPTFAREPQRVTDLSLDGIDGAPLDLARFRDKALLIVNTASNCGFTPQYAGLEALWRRYGLRGLVVIGVPSNDFGGQEPGSNAEIARFCSGTYDVTFPMAGKTVVRGPQAHPVYRVLLSTLGPAATPRWNFHKYLVGRDGRPVAHFPSQTKPDDPALLLAIEAALSDGQS